jgi:putative phage-type endonuclease
VSRLLNIAPVVQGTPEWLQLRATHHTASEAPAALGVGKYQTRAALLRQKFTGLGDDVDAGKQALFDRGHAAEAAARGLAEAIVDSDFYPITATAVIDGLPLLASLDGCTLEGDVILEHKLWNDALASDVRNGTLTPHYTVQMDQQLLVTGAEKCLFMVSDGTPERMVWCWYTSTPEKAAALIAGWRQFIADLGSYTPPEAVERAVAAPQDHLPAVSVQVSGTLAVISNLAPFGVALREFIAKIPAKPSTDNEFATCEAACKRLKEAEDKLAAAEDGALASMADVNEMRRMVGEFRELARTTRLASEKLVAARKLQIREEEVRRGVNAIGEHVSKLNERLGGSYIGGLQLNFAGVIKGLKTLDSVRNAVDTELARVKIETSALADLIDANLQSMSKGSEGFCGLFPDMKALALKAPDDLAAVIAQRVAARKASLEAERERIRAEEAAKITAQNSQRQESAPASTLAHQTAVAGAAGAPAEGEGASAPSPGLRNAAPLAPPINTGTICDRLGVTLTVQFLKGLGFEPVPMVARAGNYWRAEDFPRMCAKLAEHILAVGEAA